MAQALNTVRFGGRSQTRQLAFSPNEASDLPEGQGDEPTVFSLFGRMSVLPKYVVAEEDALEWVSSLQVPEKRPARLFDELGRNHLLFLGCQFPDWLTRFLLRTAKNSKLSVERGFFEYLVDAEFESNSSLVTFLTSFSKETQVFVKDPAEFVAELARRWQAASVRWQCGGGARTGPDGADDASRQYLHQLCK